MADEPPIRRTTVARRQLGRRMRRLREAAGKTHEDVAEADIASRTKMWKIEKGLTAVRQGDLLALLRLYSATNQTTDELMVLAAATKDTGFLESYGTSVPEWVGMYADLEAVATEVRLYASELIPGILQSPSYARAVTAADPLLDATSVDQRVAFRGARQKAFFDRKPPGQLQAVITAGALNLHVHSDSVMEEQFAHLRAINGNQASIRVLPATNGLHTAMRGPFTILLFDDPEDPDLAHVESVVGARYFERPEHVAEFVQSLERIQPQTVSLEEFM